jgi:hypothetical protein
MSSTDWDIKAAFMREQGATEATWASDDKLISLKLGPNPNPPRVEPQPPPRPPTPEEQVKQRQERQRIASLSSGRAVLAGDRDS